MLNSNGTHARLQPAAGSLTEILAATSRLAEVLGTPAEPLELSVRHGGLDLRLTLSIRPIAGSVQEASYRTALPEDFSPSGAGLRRVHRKLLEKATAEPVPTKKLVHLAGYKENTYARDAVTYLCRLGLLVRTPDGVRQGASIET